VSKKYQLMDAPEFVGHETPSATPQLGRVVHDSRGNAIWDWTIGTAVLAQITADELLDKLVVPMALGLECEAERTTSWCGDPYNRRC
jgi:hypothetical protein